MITATNPTDPPIEGGATINTYRYKLRSFRLQKVLTNAAMFCFGIIECKSNNTSNSVSARDARNFQRSLADIEREWKWAKSKRDDPTGQMEDVYTIQFPRPSELQVMDNVKLQSVAFELLNFFRVVLGTQDALQSIWLGADTSSDGDTALETLKEITTALLGDGTADTNGIFNVGVPTANYSYVGRITPPISSPEVVAQEPSSGVTPARQPDAPDGPSITDETGFAGGSTNTNPAPSGGASS